MKISDRRLRISDSLKISDFSNSLGVLQHPQGPPPLSDTPMTLSQFTRLTDFSRRLSVTSVRMGVSGVL